MKSKARKTRLNNEGGEFYNEDSWQEMETVLPLNLDHAI